MPINLWGQAEQKVYPIVEAALQREERTLKERFEVGDGFYVDTTFAFIGNGMTLHTLATPQSLKITINFRKQNDSFYRVDCEFYPKGTTSLHYHLASGTQTIATHLPIEHEMTIAQAISYTFDEARRHIEWKYPEFKQKETDTPGGYF